MERIRMERIRILKNPATLSTLHSESKRALRCEM